MNHIEIKIFEIKRPPYFKSKQSEDPWQGEQIKGHDKYDKILKYARFRRPGEIELEKGKIYFGEIKESRGVDLQGNPKKDIFTPKHEMDGFGGEAIDVEELPDTPFEDPKSTLKFDSQHDKSIVTQSLIRSACIVWSDYLSPTIESVDKTEKTITLSPTPQYTLFNLIDELCKKYREKMEGEL